MKFLLKLVILLFSLAIFQSAFAHNMPNAKDSDIAPDPRFYQGTFDLNKEREASASGIKKSVLDQLRAEGIQAIVKVRGGGDCGLIAITALQLRSNYLEGKLSELEFSKLINDFEYLGHRISNYKLAIQREGLQYLQQNANMRPSLIGQLIDLRYEFTINENEENILEFQLLNEEEYVNLKRQQNTDIQEDWGKIYQQNRAALEKDRLAKMFVNIDNDSTNEDLWDAFISMMLSSLNNAAFSEEIAYVLGHILERPIEIKSVTNQGVSSNIYGECYESYAPLILLNNGGHIYGLIR